MWQGTLFSIPAVVFLWDDCRFEWADLCVNTKVRSCLAYTYTRILKLFIWRVQINTFHDWNSSLWAICVALRRHLRSSIGIKSALSKLPFAPNTCWLRGSFFIAFNHAFDFASAAINTGLICSFEESICIGHWQLRVVCRFIDHGRHAGIGRKNAVGSSNSKHRQRGSKWCHGRRRLKRGVSQ